MASIAPRFADPRSDGTEPRPAGTCPGGVRESVRVVVVGHDLSLNATARVVRLARLLEATAMVEVVGPCFGDGVFAPLRDAVPAEGVFRGRRFPGFFRTWRELARRIAAADLVVAQKPRLASFGVARAVAARRGVPCVLDLDDDEAALFEDAFPGGLPGALRRVASLRNPNGAAWTRWLDRSIEQADAITAGSPSLARRHGATFVPYARDGRELDPARHDAAEAKRRLGVEGTFAIVFLGSFRPHKGLDDLAEAVGRLDRIRARLVVVGPLDRDVRERLARASRGALSVRSPVAEARIPEVLAAADAVVVPQRDTPYARMQLPAKLLDAMAMGRPLVVTRVGDLPEIAGEAARVVEPGPAGIEGGIRELAQDRSRARALGEAARRRFLESHDARVVRRRLGALVRELVADRGVGHRPS